MKGKLNNRQIEYILFHLNHHFELHEDILNRIDFGEISNLKNKPRIVFPLSENKLAEVKFTNNFPVIFPLDEKTETYTFDSENNLIFTDDLLKSAFYLLSGYQEILPFKGDLYQRFSFNDSIQKRLDIVMKPVVNIYFKIIEDGIREFCHRQNIRFEKRKLWDNHSFGVVLTHDVDRVDKWNRYQIGLTIKQLLNSNADGGLMGRAGNFWRSLYMLFSKDNPYWNFEQLKKLEEASGMKSAWFFLPQGEKHRDAYYSFREPRIRKLVEWLQETVDEVGLHGTYHSRLDAEKMRHERDMFIDLSGQKKFGIRQHWLSFKYPDTLRIQESLGFLFDSSWAFADYSGWRNSYCLPFRPFDFEQNRMMNIWEIPLCFMDTTAFSYEKLDLEQCKTQFFRLIKKVSVYNGLFVCLWHNSTFDDQEMPGIKKYYQDLLQSVAALNYKSVLPAAVVEKFEQNPFNGHWQ